MLPSSWSSYRRVGNGWPSERDWWPSSRLPIVNPMGHHGGTVKVDLGLSLPPRFLLLP